MSHTWVHVRVHMYINHSYRYICTHVCDVTYVIHTHSCVWRNDELRHTHECICECICTLTTHIDTYVLMCVTHMHSCVWRHICTHMCIYVAHMTSHTWVYVRRTHDVTHMSAYVYDVRTQMLRTHLHSCVWRHICTYVCDETHLYAWRDSSTCVTWLMCVTHMHSCVWRNHLYVWRDSSTWVTWLIHITHLYVWRTYALMCVT